MLPHAFPFRFVAGLRQAGDEAPAVPRLGWTAGGFYGRDGGEAPLSLLVEMMAQASLGVLTAQPAGGQADGSEVSGPQRTDSASGGHGLLAGIDAVRLHQPVRAGETLEGHAEILGSFGKLVKARVVLRRPGESTPVVEGELLLAKEG